MGACNTETFFILILLLSPNEISFAIFSLACLKVAFDHSLGG